jgi:hypothetical protein
LDLLGIGSGLKGSPLFDVVGIGFALVNVLLVAGGLKAVCIIGCVGWFLKAFGLFGLHLEN